MVDFVNNAEIQQAELAQSKSKDPHVLSFASMMIAHHSEAKQQQSALGLGTAGSSALQQLSSEGQRTLATLRDKNGKDFDRAYMQAQIDQHQKVLDMLDRQLLPNADNPQFRSHLMKLKPTVQRHLESGREAMSAIGSQQGSSGQKSNGQKSSGGSGSSSQRTGTGSATQP